MTLILGSAGWGTNICLTLYEALVGAAPPCPLPCVGLIVEGATISFAMYGAWKGLALLSVPPRMGLGWALPSPLPCLFCQAQPGQASPSKSPHARLGLAPPSASSQTGLGFYLFIYLEQVSKEMMPTFSS